MSGGRLSATGGMALAIGVILAGPRSDACDTGDLSTGEGETVPHEVYLQGVVEDVAGRVLRVGSNTIRIPADPRALPSDDGYCYSDQEDVFFARAVVGDAVEVDGSLRPDGTILAYQIVLADGAPDPSYEVVSGIVEAVGEDTFTVAGETLAIVPDRESAGGATLADWAFVRGGTSFDGVSDYWLNGRHVLVLPGDAVAATIVRTDDGRVLADDVLVRQTGEGTTLAGTLRGWDAETRTLDVDGVPVIVVEKRMIMNSPPAGADRSDLPDSYFPTDAQIPSLVGGWTRVRGVLRDGVVVAGDVIVTDVPDETTKRARRHRAGWIKTRGVVTGVGAGRLEVNRLGVRVGRRPQSPTVVARTPRVALGARIRVRARLVADGPVATAVRRN